MEEHEDSGHALVMPFVVVASKGGPFDDQAYCAGYEAGLFNAGLALGRDVSGTVRTDNLRQLDLIAMRYDRTLEVEDAGDGWSFVELAP